MRVRVEADRVSALAKLARLWVKVELYTHSSGWLGLVDNIVPS